MLIAHLYSESRKEASIWLWWRCLRGITCNKWGGRRRGYNCSFWTLVISFNKRLNFVALYVMNSASIPWTFMYSSWVTSNPLMLMWSFNLPPFTRFQHSDSTICPKWGHISILICSSLKVLDLPLSQNWLFKFIALILRN